ncbi:hypothetical protein BDV28DRAFT_125912 [Aspergillus coremiiformis]|uniref:Uncharacterized protein n=1 Tax=Aspergillus coremiiformis TaxID=138285 RepID=A0A5N6ZGV8_9EURO|nr:hypothetical protein BDV28DRAFT_125912 [Aspergillus coremiiformis]
MIMSNSDPASVESLLQEFPICKQAYKIGEKDVLLGLLHTKYEGLVNIVDAITAVRSKGLSASVPSNREKIIALLDCRRRCEEIRSLNPPSASGLPDRPVNMDEVSTLLRLHDIAIFFMNEYCKSPFRLAWDSRKRIDRPSHLSKTEKIRFLRALYRWQIFANIFGPTERPVEKGQLQRCQDEVMWEDEIISNFTEDERWHLFFGTMPPWEVAEIWCVWQYFHHSYQAPYIDLELSLLKWGDANLAFVSESERIPANCVVERANDLFQCGRTVIPCLVAMGPEFFYRFLQMNCRDRRDLILVNARAVQYYVSECWFPSRVLPLLHPAEQFNFGDDFARLEERLATLPEHAGPNLAFKCYWPIVQKDQSFDDRLFNGEFGYLLGYRQWDWGYALWDADRLTEWEVPLDSETIIEKFKRTQTEDYIWDIWHCHRSEPGVLWNYLQRSDIRNST